MRQNVTVPRLHYGRAGGEFDLAITDPESLSVGDRVQFRKTLTDSNVRKFAEARVIRTRFTSTIRLHSKLVSAVESSTGRSCQG